MEDFMVTENMADNSLVALSNSLAEAVETAGNHIVAVSARRRSAASGIVWREGVVVTADHVIERDDKISVSFGDGAKAEATLAGRDPTTDLAILTVKTNETQPATSPESKDLKVGHLVVAVARPGENGLSVSFGSISGLGGQWRTWSGGKIDQLIRPDVTFYPGFSGGALVDMTGRIVGVNTSGLSRSMPLTIPSSTVNRVVETLLKSGRISRGYLGVKMQSVTLSEGQTRALGLPDGKGLLVVSLEPAGPAATAGVLVGDILIAIEGKPVTESDSVQAVLDPETVGKPVTLRIVRGGSEANVRVTVGERPHRGGSNG
jgi:S1-C subfamily serine protease